MDETASPRTRWTTTDAIESPTSAHPTWREQTALTLTEVAAILGVSRSSAYEAARRGQLPYIKIGQRLLVPVKQLTALLEGHDAGA